MSDHRLQELIARAVCGRAEGRLHLVDVIPTEATEVLGVRVTGAEVRAMHDSGGVGVGLVVRYDVWCAGPDGTWVTRGTASMESPIPLKRLARPLGEVEVAAQLLGMPVCKKQQCVHGQISVDLQATVMVEQVGLTRLWVKAFDVDDDATEDLQDDSDSMDTD